MAEKKTQSLLPDFLQLGKPTLLSTIAGATGMPAVLSNLLGKSVAGVYNTVANALPKGSSTAQPTSYQLTKPHPEQMNQQTPPPTTTPKPTPKTNNTKVSSGGGGGMDVVNAAAQQATDQGTNPYDEYAKNIEAKIPLIQQRYQSLLDEIDRATEEGAQAQEKATTSQIGETQARAAASGVFSGSTELGTEDIIRKQAADTIASIKQSGASKKAQAVAQEAIDVGNITDKLYELAIAKDKSDRDAAQYAMDYLLKRESLNIQARQQGKGVVAQTAEGVMLIDPYTGQVISRVGSPKTAASSGQQAITAQLGKDVVTNINKSEVLQKTGSLKAYAAWAKMQNPILSSSITADEAKYKELQGEFFSLQQAAIRAIQGTRPSDYDAISYAKNVGLDIRNSPEANKVAINQLLNLVGGGTTGTSTSTTDYGDFSQFITE